MLRASPLLAAPFLLASLLLPVPAAAQAPVPLPAEAEAPSVGRFRGGVGFATGFSAPGTVIGWGLQGRLGGQLSDRLAVYASPELFYGGSFWSRPGAMFCGTLSPEIELTVADRFFVGGGPMLVVGAYAPTSGDPGFMPMPGAKLRLGVGFGSKSPARRHQFTIALEPRFIYSFDSGPSGFFSLALGYDAK